MKIFSLTTLNKSPVSFINSIERANFSLRKGVKFAEQLNKTKNYINLKRMKIFSHAPLNI